MGRSPKPESSGGSCSALAHGLNFYLYRMTKLKPKTARAITGVMRGRGDRPFTRKPHTAATLERQCGVAKYVKTSTLVLFNRAIALPAFPSAAQRRRQDSSSRRTNRNDGALCWVMATAAFQQRTRTGAFSRSLAWATAARVRRSHGEGFYRNGMVAAGWSMRGAIA
jgi:hypothetical protein